MTELKLVLAVISVFLADNLAAHAVGGFKESVSFALRICRTCMITAPESYSCVTEQPQIVIHVSLNSPTKLFIVSLKVTVSCRAKKHILLNVNCWMELWALSIPLTSASIVDQYLRIHRDFVLFQPFSTTLRTTFLKELYHMGLNFTLCSS